ncbi:MAG: AAA family ATPase [Burkholderiaceae bacterium]|nr:AAA family ATPase [Burkholderiaceae bacterium]
MSAAAPRVVVFAGPNGAGKSTHAEAILSALGIETFVNADFIARGLAGRHTETVAITAGRIMLKRLRDLAEAGQDFAFESTLSSRTFVPFLGRLKRRGYLVAIYFFALRSSRLAVRRVRHRVALGGHDVPADVVIRRFGRSLHNFSNLYTEVADEWMMFDNSSGTTARLVAQFVGGRKTIEDNALWLRLQKLAHA